MTYAEELSIQCHSIQLCNGVYTKTVNGSYRIGDSNVVFQDIQENYEDTWINYRFIPTERPTVPLPQVNAKLVNIPGSSTPLDLTRYLTGHETFQNRSGSWSFYTDPDYIQWAYGGWKQFDRRFEETYHGRVVKIKLRDDPGYFYAGTIQMNQWQTGADRSTVTLSYNLYPFKKSVIGSLDNWKWDDFDFEDGHIYYMDHMIVDGALEIRVNGGRERISPHISGSAGLKISKRENSSWVSYGDVPTANITSAQAIVPGLVIDEGTNRLRVTGNGEVTIDYRRGIL